MRVLGVDVGERRVGLALSDATGTLATPLATVEVSGPLEERAGALALQIDQLCRDEDGLDLVVVGLPRALDGRPHEQTDRVTAFVDALRERTDVAITLQDERLTSREAESRLARREKDWKRRKRRLDAAAAAIILQEYLDHARRQETGDESQEIG